MKRKKPKQLGILHRAAGKLCKAGLAHMHTQSAGPVPDVAAAGLVASETQTESLRL